MSYRLKVTIDLSVIVEPSGVHATPEEAADALRKEISADVGTCLLKLRNSPGCLIVWDVSPVREK